VQIALDALALGVGGGDDALPGVAQVVDAYAQGAGTSRFSGLAWEADRLHLIFSLAYARRWRHGLWARNLALSISAPRATTATGTYHVVVNVGPLCSDVAVQVPADCTEPRVFATSFRPGFPPDNAIDGDSNTFWHPEYSPPTPSRSR